ncbi:MAG TPA: succinate dehydrogenase, cytochrome b556 subunit [Burkholderiaceae bacterium]|nr:succinate dehydrogenase, cytochrome b556 subunit [Burkholderiaceae bacterium]
MANQTASARVRPQFRNLSLGQLASYRLPPAGLLSILHRVSGVLLFLMLPVLLWMFELSLKTESTYARLRVVFGGVLVKLVVLALVWAILHHLFAGIRYLALDLHVGIAKEPSTRSALAVFAVSLALALIAALWLFGVI